MMRSRWLLFSTILLLSMCVDNYPVPEIPGIGYLVVEGFINSNGPTTITLSHSMPLDIKSSIPAELRAKVNVESEDNMVYPLMEQGKGVYRVDNIPIDSKKRYRLYIKTASNKEYVSEYVKVKHTPPIEKITHEAQYEKGGVQIYLSTSDPDNAARYYHWDYTETWQYQSYFPTSWESINGRAVYNPNRENIYYCWVISPLKNIILASTERLSKDVVQNFPLVFVPSSSGKFKIGYRINVRQSVLTKEAYEYLAELKRNAEQQGSLFDPQPSDLLGNVRCLTDPEEPVLGYVSAYNIEEKTIFIYHYEAPYYTPSPLADICPGPRNFTRAEILEFIRTGQYIPANDTASLDPPRAIWANKDCVDCRERGGTNVKPSGWPF